MIPQRPDPRIVDLIIAWEESDKTLSAEQLCAQCPELLDALREAMRRVSRVDSMLHAHQPPLIDGFAIDGRLGRGGMGEVWRARQNHPPRMVAIKVIHSPLLASRGAQARFLREVQLSAPLEHDHIARVYDAGEHNGIAYIVMQLIEGVPLDEYVRAAKLGVAPILSLLRTVCGAVQFAHQRLVVHRDLKPGNILITPEGKPYVLDFGVARALGEVEAGAPADAGAKTTGESAQPSITPLTFEGDRPGTAAYMSPEQAAGRMALPDTRMDVYSLGAMLYELMAGQPPHDMSGTRDEVLARIATSDPRPPREVAPAIPWEVEAIILKAIARAPDARYLSAAALAEDIDRYLAYKPLAAVKPTIQYQMRKFVRRRWSTLSVTALAVAVAGATAFAYVHGLRAEQARTMAEKIRADDVAATARRQLADQYIRTGVGQWDAGDSARAALWFAQALQIDKGEPAREWADRCRIGVSLRQMPALKEVDFDASADVVHAAATARLHIVNDFGRKDFHVEIIDSTWGRFSGALDLRHDGAINSANFSPDGDRVVTASQDCTARIWSVTTGEPLTHPLRHKKEVQCAAFSPDGSRVVTGSWDATARVWDTRTGEPMPWEIKYEFITSVTFSPDGSRIATGSYAGSVRVWNATTGTQIGEFPRQAGAILAVAFSPDGKTILTGAGDGTARAWDADTNRPTLPTLRHPDAVDGVAFSDYGKQLVTSCRDGAKRTWLWRPVAGEALALEHSDKINCLAFDDAGRLMTASTDLRTWDPLSGRPIGSPVPLNARALTFGDGGRRVVTIDSARAFRIWDVMERKPLTPAIGEPPSTDALFSPDGKLLWTEVRGVSQIWDAASGKLLTPPMPQPGDLFPAFSPDGKLITTGGDDASARVWECVTGKPFGVPMKHAARVRYARFSPDGQRIVTSSWDGTARVWTKDGAPISPPLRHRGPVRDARFSPDGIVIVTASEDHTARLWDAHTFQPLSGPLIHDETVIDADFSADGRSVITWSTDGTTRWWAVPGGALLAPPFRQPSVPRMAAFSPEGTRLATAGGGNTAWVWNVAPDLSPADELLALAEMMSAEKIDGVGAPSTLSAFEWQERYKSFLSHKNRDFR